MLLRLAQRQAYQSAEQTIALARNIAAAKIQNSRLLLMREARQTAKESSEQALRGAAGELANTLTALPQAGSPEEIRGNEGYAGPPTSEPLTT